MIFVETINQLQFCMAAVSSSESVPQKRCCCGQRSRRVYTFSCGSRKMLFRYFFFAAAADRLSPLAGSFGTQRRVYTFRCGGRKLFGQRVIIAAAAGLAAHHSGGAAHCEKGFREKVYTAMWCRGHTYQGLLQQQLLVQLWRKQWPPYASSMITPLCDICR